jgi:hypothetical protein
MDNILGVCGKMVLIYAGTGVIHTPIFQQDFPAAGQLIVLIELFDDILPAAGQPIPYIPIINDISSGLKTQPFHISHLQRHLSIS